MRDRKRSSTNYPVVFFMADETDHMTGLVGLEPVVSLSKNGAAFEVASGGVSEIGYGWYALAGNADDRDTLGPLIVHAEAPGADPFDTEYSILASIDDIPGDVDLVLSNQHGIGWWGPDPAGLTEKIYTVVDEAGNPVPGIECWATTDAAGANRVDRLRTTNDLGQVTFRFDLPAGTPVWIWHREMTEGDEEVI
jgi:hypothetical protein